MSTTLLERKKRPAPEVGGKFRLLSGSHMGDGPPDCDCLDCARSNGKNHIYDPGDIIDSKQDLERRFNQGPLSHKFERVVEGQQQVPTPIPVGMVQISEAELAELRRKAAAPPVPDFAKMPDKDIRTWAEDNEIDVSKCKTRDELLKAVRS